MLNWQFTILQSTRDRFWAKTQKTDECWLWTGAKSTGAGNRRSLEAPYGNFRVCGKGRKQLTVKAHRFSFELVYGPIPEHYTLDHTCHNTLCVRPDHLELVLREENTRRGNHRRIR